MKKIIIGFILGLSFTSFASFAYMLINSELPSMVSVSDTTQIDLTKADEIIADPLQPGMSVTSSDLNAKFHSLNMKISKLDCDTKGGTFTEADLLCFGAVRQPASGESYERNITSWNVDNGNGRVFIKWNGVTITGWATPNTETTFLGNDGWTYHKGIFQESPYSPDYFSLYRTNDNAEL